MFFGELMKSDNIYLVLIVAMYSYFFLLGSKAVISRKCGQWWSTSVQQQKPGKITFPDTLELCLHSTALVFQASNGFDHEPLSGIDL